MNFSLYDIPEILIVDDDHFTAELFKEILEEENFHIDVAYNGISAIEKATSKVYDLILLDVMMPETNGFEVCKKLKQQKSTMNIPVIFITALEDNQNFLKGFELGAIDYFKKPINKLELVVKISNYLQLFQAEKKLKESELRYRSIVEDQTEFIVRYLLDGTRTFVNDAYCSYLEKSRNELIGKSIFPMIEAEDRDSVIDRLRSLNPGMPAMTNEYKVLHPNGKIYWQHWIDRAIFDTSGELIEFQSIGRDITEQKDIRQKILQTILETEERERARFAEELHDGLGPLLAAAKLYFKTLEELPDKSTHDHVIEKGIYTIDKAISSIKEIANNISPHILRNFGLVSAMNSYLNKIQETKHINVDFQSNIEKRLDTKFELGLFRIFKEFTNNTLKHAKARNIEVHLIKRNGTLVFTYLDDGIGFDTNSIQNENSAKGINSIMSRVRSLDGQINLSSRSGAGMHAEICF